jgi:ABC-type antimicrobial peptide transport system permease subunit
MKIQYGIAGFVIGIMSGLLIGLLEMKLMRGLQLDTITPFVIGITVISSIITGVVIGIKMAKRYSK